MTKRICAWLSRPDTSRFMTFCMIVAAIAMNEGRFVFAAVTLIVGVFADAFLRAVGKAP